jgi:hypothetical protein
LVMIVSRILPTAFGAIRGGNRVPLEHDPLPQS